MTRYLLATLIVAHGVAHIVGFLGPWHLMDPEGVTYSSGLLNGWVHVSDRTMRALGIVWLLLALGFLVTAYAVGTERSWWSPVATTMILASSVMCVVEWPAARIGLAVNAALLAGLLVVRSLGWL